MKGLVPANQELSTATPAGMPLAVRFWSTLRRWFKTNTAVPQWFPARLRHPLIAYLLAALVTVLAVLLDMLFMQSLPGFGLSSLVTLLAVVIIALTWGAGPSLIATLFGAWLLDYLILPRFSGRAGDTVRALDDVMVLAVGLTVTIFTSLNVSARRNAEQSARVAEQARQSAEELTISLAQERARANLERQRLEAIFESMADAVSVYDSEGRIQQVNSASLDLYGLDDIAAGRSMSASERGLRIRLRDGNGRLLSQEDWQTVRILKGQVIAGAAAEDVTFTNFRGREVDISISGAPVRDADGRIVGAVTIMRDVTERRKPERRTRRALNALLAMAEVLVQGPGVQAAPDEATARQIAQRLAELTRYVLECKRISVYALNPETGAGIPLVILGLTPEQEQRWWAGERFGVRLIDGSLPNITARLCAGELLILDMSQPPLSDYPNPYAVNDWLIAPMRIGEQLIGFLTLDHGGAAHCYTAEEIALTKAIAKLGALVIERERLREEREAARAAELALRETNRQMNAFLSIVSHELKNPLTAIILGLQKTQRRLSSLAQRTYEAADASGAQLEPVAEQLARTRGQVERMDRLVNDLLDVSRIQVGKLEMRKAPVDLTSIAREAVEEQRQINPGRTIWLAVPATPIPPVFADAARIGQVVTNYLTNALKYSAGDRLVEVGVKVAGPSVCLWVRDQGPGLPLAEQARIWERFYRAAGVEIRSGTGVGLGLGLSISRMIIEYHQGQVGVQSTPGEGSTFWFTLPLAAQEERELEVG